MEPSDALQTFRRSFYECLHRRGDALFELADAILSTYPAAPSPVHLSLQPAHRRGWGSFYAALARGRIDAEVLRDLLVRHPLAGSAATPVYAVDTSTWPEPSAHYACEDAGYGAVRVRAFSKMHPRSTTTKEGAAAGLCPSWSVRSSWSRSNDCLGARGVASRGCCGCGGMDPKGRHPTWISSGAPTSDASTWSIPSASSSSAWDGRRLGCATPSRRIGGRGWFWRLSPS